MYIIIPEIIIVTDIYMFANKATAWSVNRVSALNSDVASLQLIWSKARKLQQIANMWLLRQLSLSP